MLLIVTLLLLTIHSAAADNWTYYLDGNAVNDIAIQGDIIWCATNGGMIRWNRADKTNERHYPFRESICCTYQYNMFRSVAIDKNGVVWCSNGNLFSYDGLEWIAYNENNSGLPEGAVVDIYVDWDNIVWLQSSVVSSFDGTSFKQYATDKEGRSIRLLGIDNANKKWFAVDGGVVSFDGSNWNSYFAEDGFPNVMIYAMTSGNDNVVWFALGNKTIVSFDGNDFSVYEGLSFNPHTIAVDVNNNVWCGGNKMVQTGLARFDGVTWSYYNSENSGLQDNKVISIITDDSGILLATWKYDSSTGNGLTMFDGTTWDTWLVDGPLDYYVIDVAVDHNNVKWFGTFSGGVASYDGTDWKTYTVDDGLVSNNARSIAVDKNNTKWFLGSGVISGFDGKEWETFSYENSGIMSAAVNSIAVDNDTAVWIGTSSRRGVAQYHDDTWTSYSNDGMGHAVGGPIGVDKDNVKWFVVEGGAASFDGTNWTYYETDTIKDMPDRIVFDENDVMWVSTRYYGITRFDGSTWTHISKITDGFDPALYLREDIAVDSKGVKWFISKVGFTLNVGLTRYDDTVWEYFRDDFWLMYDAHRMAIDHDDVIWMTTYSGIVRYDPNDNGNPMVIEKTENLPAAVYIDSNYPNPFNMSTTIEFTLPKARLASLSIYDITGRKVRELVSEHLSAGKHSTIWNGSDTTDRGVSSGVYVARLRQGSSAAAKRIMYLK